MFCLKMPQKCDQRINGQTDQQDNSYSRETKGEEVIIKLSNKDNNLYIRVGVLLNQSSSFLNVLTNMNMIHGIENVILQNKFFDSETTNEA